MAIFKNLIDQPGYQITCLDNIGDKNHSDNKAPASENYYRRLPLQFNPVTMPTNMMTLGVSHQNTSITKNDSLDFKARHLGTALHRSLKQIATDGVEQWPAGKRNP